jgi:hypothetical protein
MTGATTPDGLAYPEIGDSASPRVQIASLADTTQVALNKRQLRTYRWTSTASMNDQTGMSVGDMGYNQETNTPMIYSSGSVWAPLLGARLPGSYVMMPTSVVGGVAGTDGIITPSAGTKTLSVNGVFTNAFRRFRLDYWYYTGDDNGNAVRLRSAGVDYTGANYSYTVQNTVPGSVTAGYAVGSTQMGVAGLTSTIHGGHVEFTNPMHTNGFAQKGMQGMDGSALGFSFFSGYCGNVDASTFDGFTFTISTTSLNPFQPGGWFKVTAIA